MDIYYYNLYLWLRSIKSFKAERIESADEADSGMGYLCKKGSKSIRFLLAAYVPINEGFRKYPYMKKRLKGVSEREKFSRQLIKNESFYALWKRLKPKNSLSKA